MNRIFQTKVLIKYTFFVFASMFITGIVIYFNYYPKDYYELRECLNKNSISIKTSNNLNKVNIYWYSDTKSGQIVKNRKNTDLVFKEYGPNKFIALYEKDTIKEFMYVKSNNWHGHKHIIFL